MSKNKILPIFLCKIVISGDEFRDKIHEKITSVNNNLETKLKNQYNVIVTVTLNGILGDLQFELFNAEKAKQIDFESFKKELLLELNKLNDNRKNNG